MVDLKDLIKVSDYEWEIPRSFRSDMQVPVRLFATRRLLEAVMDDKSLEQAVNSATLPGLVGHVVVMPDMHQGYGFPIGGVAATRYPEGVISPGGIGYDINCGVRLLASQIEYSSVKEHIEALASALNHNCPSGVGTKGHIRILRSRNHIRLVVIGTAREDGAVEALVRALGIGRHIEFTGRIDAAEFVRQYARASLAVIPSVYEGFGLPAGEAMACAVPVVSTTGGALPEVVGDAGRLVPPADPPALARAIRELLDNPGTARELGQAGFQRVHRHFTWRRAAEQTVSVYLEAISGHRRLRPS